MTRCWLVCVAMTAAWGQTVQIPPVTVNRDSANILRLLYTGRADQPVSAIQWELVVPKEVRIDAADVAPGTAAESAGKSISCSNRTTAAGKLCICVLIGGVKPIPDGAIAIVKFSTAADAPTGAATVKLQKILAVSVDLKKMPLTDAAGTIKIQ